MSFANLKKQSKGASFSSLADKLKGESKGGGYEKDARYWNFEVDKSGNGFAVIRFLSAPDKEEFPYVKLYEYAFKHKVTDKWYINLSRKTLGPDEADPVDEIWADLWNQGRKEESKQYSRSTRYVSNILVISDSKHPENEGKVFLYKYGPRIFQKIEGAIDPEFEDETAFNPFDMWGGANFKLKARLLDGQRSYDKSEFEKPAPISEDDAVIENIWSKCYSLLGELDPSKFKTYEQLKARLDQVIGRVGQAANKETSTTAAAARTSTPASRAAEKADEELPPAESEKPSLNKDSSGDDSDYEAYRRLLED